MKHETEYMVEPIEIRVDEEVTVVISTVVVSRREPPVPH